MNIHAYVVARRASGRLKWIDVHVYLSGELVSESTRRVLLPYFAQQNAGLLARLTHGEGSYVKNLPRLAEIRTKISSGDCTGAMAIIESLPTELRETKALLAMRMQAAQQVGNEAYAKVIDDWERCFPGDPSLALVGIDGAFLRKDYDGVLKRIGQIEQMTGADPYLDLLRANTLFLAGRFDECREVARRALAVDPNLASAFDVLLQIELDAKNHPATAALLDEVEAAYSADMEASIADNAAYAEFRASDEYRAWKARRTDRHAVKVE